MGGKHGGNIYQVARQLGRKPETILDFSANINPLGYSPRIRKILASPGTAILNYPDREAHDFIHALASYHNLPPEHFLGGNGSTEFIYLLPDILRPKSVLLVTPTFTEYEHSFQRAKGVVFYHHTRQEGGFRLDAGALCDELKRGYSALYICNPGSPTGVLIPRDIIQEIVKVASRRATSVVLDETFMDYAEAESMKAAAGHYDNLYILRSMTKLFALPGIRAGYLIAHPRGIDKVRSRQGPWSMNALAQRASIASLQDAAYIRKSRAYIHKARNALASDLQKIPCLTVFNGCCNFLLVRLSPSADVTTTELYERLFKKGILIRTCEDFQGLDETFFRIAVKKKNENTKLAAEIKKILGEAGKKKRGKGATGSANPKP